MKNRVFDCMPSVTSSGYRLLATGAGRFMGMRVSVALPSAADVAFAPSVSSRITRSRSTGSRTSVCSNGVMMPSRLGRCRAVSIGLPMLIGQPATRGTSGRLSRASR